MRAGIPPPPAIISLLWGYDINSPHKPKPKRACCRFKHGGR